MNTTKGIILEAATKRKKIKFIMLLGASLHKYGASSDRVEKALNLLAAKLKLQAEFFSTPTSLLASFKIDDEREYTRLRRLDVGKVNLYKLLLIDEIVDQTIDDSLSLPNAMDKINSVLENEALYKGFLVDMAYAVVSFNIAIIIGGNFYDAILAGALGFIIGMFTESIKIERLSSISDGVLAFVASVTSILFAKFSGLPIHADITTVSSLIILLPGLMLTTSVSELASNNLMSGASRLLGAIMILLKITFGVYLANVLVNKFNVEVTPIDHIDKELIFKIMLIPLTAAGFVVSFQARFKEYIWICIGCVLTFICSKFSIVYLGFAMSAFASGAFIASFSNFFSRVTKKPALITLLPGITLLVPGALGYSGIEAMINENTLEGINALLRTFIIALALVSGTFFGSILVKPKRSLDI